jgi:hypothetical protein
MQILIILIVNDQGIVKMKYLFVRHQSFLFIYLFICLLFSEL